MADIPPVSDPQLAAIIQQNKARRQRAIIIFVSVALALGIGLGSSALYFSAQAKKKRNVAYSHVVKCLFGKPLESGEPPMSRVRSAWRARLLSEPKASGPTQDDQEAAKAKMWPNRCVPELMAFTDTLKEVGDMKEGEKDLGFYSRELSKQTAGDNWKNVDTYQAAVEAFVGEAQKGNFQYVDVPDVQAPELLDAEPIDKLFPKTSALADTHVNAHARTLVTSKAARWFVPAGKGKPPRLCTTEDGKTLSCTALGSLPPQAAGIPWVLSAEDAAPSLLAFGREGGVADGSSISTGVYRSSDGVAVVPADAFYVVGGYAKSDGSAALLLKDAKDPQGDKFQIGHVGQGPLQLDKVALTDWNEAVSGVAMVGPYVVWVTSKEELHGLNAFAKGAQPAMIATLPGEVRSGWSKPAFAACTTAKGLEIGVRVHADALDRMLVFPASDAGFGKPQVTDDGDFSCTDDGAVVATYDTLTTCTEAGCNGTKIESPRGDEATMVIDGALVRVTTPSGLLRIEWDKGGKAIATKVFDAQMKGTVLLGESKLAGVTLVPRRSYGLVVADIGDTQYVARVDAAGNTAATAFKP